MPKGVYFRTEEHKQKLSNSWNYDKHFTKECRAKISKSNSISKLGTIRSIESRKKQSGVRKKLFQDGKLVIWNKGLYGVYKQTEISNHKRSLKMKGIRHSDSWRLKHIENAKINPNYGMRGKIVSQETRNKLRLFKLGKNFLTEEGRKILSNSMKKSRREQKIITPIKDTKIEVKIQNYLKELNIEFFTHQYMHIEHGYQCDILIPSLNLVIECDGNYWHKYPVGLEKDHIRTKELIEKGFKVLRLWGNDIKNMKLIEFKNILESKKY